MDRIDRLHALMEVDLSEARGGFGWWYGYFDQPRVIFASDYLLQITGQMRNMLNMAAWHETAFNEAWYAETTWLRQHANRGVDPFTMRGDPEEKRAARIDAALTGFFQACGSSLDFLAACTIGVLGIAADLVTASWTTVTAAKTGPDKVRRNLLAGEDSPARILQDDAISNILTAFDRQPSGWLTWALDMRNVMIHRAHRFELRRFYRRSQRDELQYVLHLPKNPQLTDAEAFVLGEQPQDLLLWEHAGTTMSGVLDNLIGAATQTVDLLYDIWQRRRNDPALLAQPDAQWKKVYPERRDLSLFGGFGAEVAPVGNEQVHVPPATARRLRAAKLLDSGRPYWVRALTFPGGA
ncbi:hypothetical protein [Micromonospora chalcea]|uniref:hypothetical protein n=1 Tax=Micromonospora chalcea TaxID=1874 RepID=UPI0033299F97